MARPSRPAGGLHRARTRSPRPRTRSRPQDGKLEMPDELLWLTDFDRAVHDGLGLRDRPPARPGARRVRPACTSSACACSTIPRRPPTGLETLLRNHRYSGTGLSFVAAGHADQQHGGHRLRALQHRRSGRLVRRRCGRVRSRSRRTRCSRRDGQWFADLLGIDPAVVTGVAGAHGLDQRDARAMQALLWPATMGYLMGTQLEPVFSDRDGRADPLVLHPPRARSRVAARRSGSVASPTGSRRPRAFSRMSLAAVRGPRARPRQPTRLPARDCRPCCRCADEDWDALVAHGAVAGPGGDASLDAHETLLGILGLHPSSAEFHYRYAQSIDQIAEHRGAQRVVGGLLDESWIQAGLDTPAPAAAAAASAGPARNVRRCSTCTSTAGRRRSRGRLSTTGRCRRPSRPRLGDR